MGDLLKKPDMVIECSQEGQGHKLWIEVLIFIGVFIVSNIISGVVTSIISVVYLFSSDTIGSLLGQSMEDISELGGNYLNDIISSDFFTVLMLMATVVTIIVVLIFCRFIEKRPLRTMGFRRKNLLRDYLLGLVVGTGIFSLAIFICIMTGTADFIGISKGFNVGIIVLFFVGYLIQGMSEEVLCRGYFMVSCARKNSLLAAVIANSLIFALLHILNPGVGFMPIVNITLFGIFASVYMIKSGNIWGAAAIHSSWNFVQGNIFGIQVSGLQKTESIFAVTLKEGGGLINGGSFGLEGGLAVTLVLALSIIAVLYYKSENSNMRSELDG